MFRSDINALRGYAIAFVVLYHFGVIGFGAGFIGVDIFFVISGYLMTKIISDRVLAGRFSFYDFFSARCIRIIPPLFVMLLLVGAAAFFVFPPELLKKFSLYALSSIFFFSNYIYLLNAGDYFSTNTIDIPLIHTWSLSVEWQFYIALPLIIWCATRIKSSLNVVRLSVVLLFLVSLLISIKISNHHQMFSFFMLPSRAWEMAIGGICYLFFDGGYKRKTAINGIGISLIIGFLIFVDKEGAWPGYMALIPTVGSVLVIASRYESCFLYNNIAMQRLGDWSYSIYLWHWIVVFFYNFFGLTGDLYTVTGVLLSVVLGGISFMLIEKPSKEYFKNMSTVKFVSTFIVCMTLLSVTLTYAYKNNGLPERASDNYLANTSLMKMPSSNDGWCFYDFNDNPSLPVGSPLAQNCRIGSRSESAKKALLIGDSFSGHYSPFWDGIGKSLNISVQGISTNWCYPSLDDGYTGPKSSIAYQQCILNREYLKNNVANYDYIILAANWANVMLQGKIGSLEEVISFIHKSGKKVIVMDEPHAFDVNISEKYRNMLWNGLRFDIGRYSENGSYDYQTNVYKHIHEIDDHTGGVFVVKSSDMFNDGQLSDAGMPYALDNKHISVYGSIEASKRFERSKAYSELSKFMQP